MKASYLLLVVLVDFAIAFQSSVTISRRRNTIDNSNANDRDSLMACSSDDENIPASCKRRRLFFITSLAIVSSLYLPQQQTVAPALARGLVMFPCKPGSLHNTYHFLRSGTSMMESQDILSTNPLFLTNRNDDALSLLGQEQVLEACQELLIANANVESSTQSLLPTLIVHSLAASSMDTANLVASQLKLGRDRIMPEYTFLDPRAIGLWDMTKQSDTADAIIAMDQKEAGPHGQDGKPPPPNEDGTPSETLADQAVRLRQELSVLESLYSGDTILIVFRDGTTPALLSAMMAGIPYNDCHVLEYKPGEVRVDVTMERTLELFAARRDPNSAYALEYKATLEHGQQTLQQLRAGNVVNRKDQRNEAERVAIETEFNKQQELQRVTNERKQVAKAALQRQIHEQRQQDQWKATPQTILASAGVLGVLGAAAVIGLPKESTEAGSNSAESSPTGNDPSDDEQSGIISAPQATLYSTSSDRPIRFERRRTSDSNTTRRSVADTQDVAPIDRKAVAEDAMKSYLDKDDGADDWLQSLAQIIQEPEEDEDDEEGIYGKEQLSGNYVNGNATSVYQ
ncbi:hypothetical protein MPSEU_000940800 [Mayamaea pseudoterrestris]|nr:hypothetical protein MPSEU_000940800 [Mayamaea pseudoterrestris]